MPIRRCSRGALAGATMRSRSTRAHRQGIRACRLALSPRPTASGSRSRMPKLDEAAKARLAAFDDHREGSGLRAVRSGGPPGVGGAPGVGARACCSRRYTADRSSPGRATRGTHTRNPPPAHHRVAASRPGNHARSGRCCPPCTAHRSRTSCTCPRCPCCRVAASEKRAAGNPPWSSSRPALRGSCCPPPEPPPETTVPADDDIARSRKSQRATTDTPRHRRNTAGTHNAQPPPGAPPGSTAIAEPAAHRAIGARRATARRPSAQAQTICGCRQRTQPDRHGEPARIDRDAGTTRTRSRRGRACDTES